LADCGVFSNPDVPPRDRAHGKEVHIREGGKTLPEPCLNHHIDGAFIEESCKDMVQLLRPAKFRIPQDSLSFQFSEIILGTLRRGRRRSVVRYEDAILVGPPGFSLQSQTS
jgi:hypothetical protein